ncbi:MAG: helix-turn-helix domain-containing protein [Gammaproteobacteria bacterium]|nr:helix-turn-helix domain-containing protein [Gammaproteobacteria bacterium]
MIISILSVGFSVGSAVVLFIAYLFFLNNVNKSGLAVISCALLLIAVAAIQLAHLDFFIGDSRPLQSPVYRFWLFLVAPMFFFFSRFILLPEAKIPPILLLHFMPLLCNYFLPGDIAIPLIFMIGSGYCLWLASMIYGLRAQRQRFHIEMFFFGLFSIQAVVVLMFGFAIPYIDAGYFYLIYTNSIGLAFLLIVAALIVFPDLLAELAEVAKISYSASTLTEVDVAKKILELEHLIATPQIYQNEQLNLALLAEATGLSSHQLSELINVHYGMGFSRFVRQRRVDVAKRLLIDEPKASILSISLDTGFQSQSNFYAAFREITGEPPGSYRKRQTANS